MSTLKNTKKSSRKKMVLNGTTVYVERFDPAVDGSLFSDKLRKVNNLLQKTIFLKRP
ncbi:hypothetical protein [Niabella drilacis]|uniref:Transposon-encoded protein TnpW n=1 Tax=Niabella drilacis (strain DSM 25811 / CCM 8410 / CCUG 62505 / LMG 26954 / E90) TaxID=1285928 RepID=A0A1G6LSJ9_NIADE|nr:hypothetical protein [Niabella drilacis]SDC45735.1 hypothetical protein SAMN04487894_102434 [Niabella drilacis]